MTGSVLLRQCSCQTYSILLFLFENQKSPFINRSEIEFLLMVVFLAASGFARGLLALTNSSLAGLSFRHEVRHYKHHRHVALPSFHFLASFCRFRPASWVRVKTAGLLVVKAVACGIMLLWNRLKQGASPVTTLVNFWPVGIATSGRAVWMVHCPAHHVSTMWRACKHLVLLEHPLLVPRYCGCLHDTCFAETISTMHHLFEDFLLTWLSICLILFTDHSFTRVVAKGEEISFSVEAAIRDWLVRPTRWVFLLSLIWRYNIQTRWNTPLPLNNRSLSTRATGGVWRVSSIVVKKWHVLWIICRGLVSNSAMSLIVPLAFRR